jgi:hypothetical protein
MHTHAGAGLHRVRGAICLHRRVPRAANDAAAACLRRLRLLARRCTDDDAGRARAASRTRGVRACCSTARGDGVYCGRARVLGAQQGPTAITGASRSAAARACGQASLRMTALCNAAAREVVSGQAAASCCAPLHDVHDAELASHRYIALAPRFFLFPARPFTATCTRASCRATTLACTHAPCRHARSARRPRQMCLGRAAAAGSCAAPCRAACCTRRASTSFCRSS